MNDDVVAAIDHALADHACSGDAMRWNPEHGSQQVETPTLELANQLGRGFITTRHERTGAGIDIDDAGVTVFNAAGQPVMHFPSAEPGAFALGAAQNARPL